MIPLRRPPLWLVALLAAAALIVLYRVPLRTGFLNDDYLFLEEARTRPLAQSLFEPGALANYYRPLSRQAWFAALTPLSGGHPLVFHLADLALYLAAIALLVDLLLALVPTGAAIAGALFFALLPMQRVLLTWVSCSQDLLALAGVLGAFALWRRGRTRLALLAYLAALASKEAALPLPAALAAWHVWIERRPAGELPRRLAPFALMALGWGAVLLAMRAGHPGYAAFLHFSAVGFLAGYVHGVQSLLGLDDPASFAPSLVSHLPDLAALVLLAPLALLIAREPAPAPPAAAPAPARSAAAFALAWFAAFAFVCGPVAATWSSYYYAIAAVGGAILVALACRRLARAGALALIVGLAWWHAGATSAPAFAVRDDPWQWTSHLTSFYFQRAARLTSELSRELKAAEPAPEHGTRFFFAILPPWAGFQMGNGALVRTLYRDSTLQAHFYSRFSDSTADDRPCVFLYWDGDSLRRLYGRARDPWFQVGADLLLLDQPRGAMHAFRRALVEGGDRSDNLYWLGWATLWSGRRDLAESAWKAFGAGDDSVRFLHYLGEAREELLVKRDTVLTRRLLAAAIQFGIGQPEGHAVLGPLLMRVQPKYGLLELKVASWLKPNDWMARRDLALGLAAARLDDGARAQLAELKRTWPDWRSDPAVVRADSLLATRSGRGLSVARF